MAIGSVCGATAPMTHVLWRTVKMKDNIEFYIEFIKEVESNPALYDSTLTEYSNKENTKLIWSKIAKKYHVKSHEIRAKWKSIRSAYTRTKSVKPRSRSLGANKNEYYLANHLKFLDPFIKLRSLEDTADKNEEEEEEKPIQEETVFVKVKSEENLVEPEADIDASSNSDNESTVHNSSIASCSRLNPLQSELKREMSEVEVSALEYFTAKRRRLEDEGRVAGERDSCELFLRSLAPHMRSMSQQDQLWFQREVLELIEKFKFPEPQNP